MKTMRTLAILALMAICIIGTFSMPSNEVIDGKWFTQLAISKVVGLGAGILCAYLLSRWQKRGLV